MKRVMKDSNRAWKVMFYGMSDVGKTGLAGSAEQVIPTLYLDVEDGAETLKELERVTGQKFWPTDIFQPMTAREVTDSISQIEESIRTHGIRAIVIDTLSRLQSFSLLESVDSRDPKNRNIRSDPDAPAQQDWGRLLIQIMRLVKQLYATGIHIICLCQAEVVEGRNEKGETFVREIRPYLRGQFKDMAGGFFDVVGYMERFNLGGQDLRRLTFRNHSLAFTRSRSLMLPDYIDNPLFKDIVGYLKPRTEGALTS